MILRRRTPLWSQRFSARNAVQSKTKAIARAGAGVNNIPCEECVKKGIVVFNTPGANANAVKELAILGLLIGSRKVADALAWAQA